MRWVSAQTVCLGLGLLLATGYALSEPLSGAPSAEEQTTEAGTDAYESDESEASPPEKAGSDLEVLEALTWRSLNDRIAIGFGAYSLYDWVSTSQGSDLDAVLGDPGTEHDFRALRIDINGTFFDRYMIKLQYGYENGESELLDNYVAVENIPYLGRLTIGHFTEPFGLEVVASTRHLTFMEPALNAALAPGRNAGAMFSNTVQGGRMTWAGGFFAETDTADAISDSDARSFTCRITGLPRYEDGGRELIHLGLGYTYRSAHDTLRIQPRPESYLAPRYLDTREFDADHLNTLDLEAAYVRGPFSLQAEYTWGEVSSAKRDTELSVREWAQGLDWWTRLLLRRMGGSFQEALAEFPELAARMPDLANTTVAVTQRADIDFNAFYIQGSYVLTGEHRTYRKDKGVFGTVVPDRPFLLRKGKRGPGAWEVAARISTIDLDDGFIQGGRETNYSLGLNWYANPYVRMSANYIHADIDREGVDDNANIFQIRFQLDLKQKDVRELQTFRTLRRIRPGGAAD